MAIERTHIIYSTLAAEAATNLAEYLNTNAVPKYFDKVELNTDAVSCYVGEVELLKIKMFLNQSGSGVTVTTENGETITLTGTSTNAQFQYAYKCNNGISFAQELASDIVLTITKDNEGNTTIIFVSSSSGSYLNMAKNSTSGYNKLYVVNKKSQSIFYKFFYCLNRGEQLTVFCPLPVGDTAAYTPDAFLMPYTQFTSHGVIDVDGCKYLSNGLWCVKDGGVAGE